jgi:ArsR family transcriptional regulator
MRKLVAVATTTLSGQAELPVLANCCSPVVGEVMPVAEAEALAGSLKAIADPTRLRLVSLVAAHAGREACVCELIEPVGLSQPTVSHHLKILVEAGILAREQRGKWAYYRLVPDALVEIARLLTPHPG